MGNAIAKAVINELADLYSQPRYLADLLTDLREPLGLGDTVEVPNIGTLTVSQASSSGTPQDVSNQAVSPSIISLSCNNEPAIFCEIPAMVGGQLLNGAFPRELARQGLVQLRGSIDSTIAAYLAKQVAWTTGTAATYHDNVAAASLTRAHFLASKATLETLNGAHNLAFFVSAFALAAIMNLAEFIPNFQQAEAGVLGIPKVGSMFGVPVYQTNSVPSSPTAAASASNIASNVCTFTVPTNHGFVAGQKITTSGFTVDLGTATPITSTTSTTIVAPVTGSNGSNGTGTITGIDALNLLIDLPHAFVAMQRMPGVRVVPFPNRTSNSLQLSAVYGNLARAGRVRVIHTPATAL